MVLIYILIIFFLFLIAYQIVLGTGIKEGMDNSSDLDKLDKKVDNVRADVFDLSLNLVSLQKNVATLLNQQAGFASSLKDTANNVPNSIQTYKPS